MTEDKKNIMLRRMAGYISHLDIDEDICKKVDKENNQDCEYADCVSCIIKYFEEQ